MSDDTLEYKILVAVRGFGPINIEHLDGKCVGETARRMVDEGLLWWGPHLGYRITDAGRAKIDTINEQARRGPRRRRR